MADRFIVIGLVLSMMALLGSVVDRLPLSSALIYLLIGIVLGPGVSGWLTIDPIRSAPVLEVLFLIAVLVSLFTVGLKLRTPASLFTRRLWGLPLRLAGPAMVITIALVAVFAHVVLRLDWAAATLLGAMLAPTDPVLASDVQVHHEDDRDGVRFGLSSEGGLNDATASPFVLLGLGRWVFTSSAPVAGSGSPSTSCGRPPRASRSDGSAAWSSARSYSRCASTSRAPMASRNSSDSV